MADSSPLALPMLKGCAGCVIMDGSLAPLARKLRMIGVEARVAGEMLRETATSSRHVALTARQGGGLRRVTICQQRAESELRRAAAEGTLRLCAPTTKHAAMRGPLYHMLATEVDAQFAELVEVLGLHEALVAGDSRCGVCNSAAWRTLSANEVAGRVPAAVAANESVFYECGHCLQIFWPGVKYESTMESLRHSACGELPAGQDRLQGGKGDTKWAYSVHNEDLRCCPLPIVTLRGVACPGPGPVGASGGDLAVAACG
jgi:uncharacterized protein with PIN domain